MGQAAATATTVAALLAQARTRLRDAGIGTADLDARLLVADALGCDAAGLVLRAPAPVDGDSQALVAARLARRMRGEPVHRILGRRAFYAHEFRLSAETLEPRPDTEALVELCRGPFAEVIARKGFCRFADVGTGSGAIAVSLLALFPDSVAVAIDISPGALRTARANAAGAGVAERFHAVAMDHLSALSGPLDLLVSNPPYICSSDLQGLPRDVRDFDPPAALDGGADGLRSYRALARQSAACLHPSGHVLVEIGHGQRGDVVALFEGEGLVLAASAVDLGGVERALWFRR